MSSVDPLASSSDGRSHDELLAAAREGRRDALEALIEQHLPGLRAYVRLRCGPALRAKESASDIVQSACRDVLENLDRFQQGGEAGFRAWLYATALRKVADRAEYWGAQKRDLRREQPIHGAASGPDLGALYASVCSPSQQAIGHEAAERLERAFDALADEDREIIVLARLVDLGHAEIAEQLGIAPGTSRMRLFRALAALAEALGDDAV
ncbi:MAG: sigma-70 family RNA polymerase sigma factor [Planctomycetes bacterium]|nr:sigma-70 family RNA polymerase sigma factor [Planctomycetota bacterium]